jgi:hypothetical protein
VRVQLPTSADIILTLGDPTQYDYPIQFDWQISISNGGTSNNLKLRSSIRGQVVHVVASNVVVRAQQAGTIPAGTKTRISAMAALGSPFRHCIARHTLMGAGQAGSVVQLKPFTHSIKIAAYPASAVALATVRQKYRLPTGANYVTGTRALADYATEQALDPTANEIEIINGAEILQFEETQYFDM